MAIPAEIKKCLDLQNIEYGITAESHIELSEEEQSALAVTSFTPETKDIAKLIVLQDSIGKLQIMVPANCLIDLTEICELLGRNLQALGEDESQSLLSDLKTDNFPSIPQLTGLPTIADNTLFEKNVVYLEVGQEGYYIKLEQDQFKRAMNEVDLGNFAKPFSSAINTDEQSDEAKITEAVEKFTTLRIKQRLENTLEIPPMPDTADKIIKLRVDPDAGVGELAKVVETDPSLAAQVVSWAGSPFYGAPGKIKSVHDAVVRVLGFDLVINLALGLALGKTLNLPNDGPRSVTPYWQQAVYSALSMEAVVRKIPPKKRPALGLAYLSGLLHNFGYLILGYIFPPHFSVISRYLEVNSHVNHHHIEEYLLGVSREQISSWLLKSWHMPEEVVTAIRWQQYPDYDGDHNVYSKLLFITNQLLSEKGISNQTQYAIPKSIYDSIHLDEFDAREAIESVIEKSNYIKTMASILGGKED